MSHFDSKRALRRFHAARVSRQRFKHRVTLWGAQPRGAGYYVKIAGLGCACRKRRPGNPKISYGMCKMDKRQRILAHRQVARRLHEGRAIEDFE